MGAQTFLNSYLVAEGETVNDAFNEATATARYNYGHAGYTGTIAEKDEAVICGDAPDEEAAKRFAQQLLDDGDERIDDKWGPAGAVTYPGGVVFVGWASS